MEDGEAIYRIGSNLAFLLVFEPLKTQLNTVSHALQLRLEFPLKALLQPLPAYLVVLEEDLVVFTVDCRFGFLENSQPMTFICMYPTHTEGLADFLGAEALLDTFTLIPLVIDPCIEQQTPPGKKSHF